MTKEKKTMTALPRGLHGRLKELAAKKRVLLSTLVEEMLENQLKQDGVKNGK